MRMEWGGELVEQMAAILSIVLMGICGLQLIWRLGKMLGGRERNAMHPLSFKTMGKAACVGLLSRLALYLLAYGMYRVFQGGTQTFETTLPQLWTHWDARHYLGIARDGYTAVGDERLRLVFFPLYPWLMRILSPLTNGDLFRAGTVISLVCSAIATALVYDLGYMHFGTETGWRSTAYFLLNPLSVFLCCVYTEALFLCLTLLCVVLLRRNHPWWAAFCGALSALTRMPGVIVCGLFMLSFLVKIPQKKASLRALMACVVQVMIVCSGLLVYWGVNWYVTGDPWTYLVYQRENWFQEAGTFWASTANTVHYVLTEVGAGDWLWTWGFQLLCMVGIYVGLAVGARYLPFDLAAYSWVYTVVVLSPTWLLSGARYLYALCSLSLLLARLPVGKRGHAWMLILSAVLLVVWTYGYTLAGRVL